MSMVNIRRSASIHSVTDCGVLGQFILQIHDGFCASDEQDAIAIIQRTDLIGGKQFFATMSSDELR